MSSFKVPVDPSSLLDYAHQSIVRGAVSFGVNTTILGQDFEQALKTTGRNVAVNTFAGYAASEIGVAYAEGDLDPVSHKVFHGAIGGLGGIVLDSDDPQRGFTAGFTSAAATEFFADLLRENTQSTVRHMIDQGYAQGRSQEDIRGEVDLYIQRQGEIARFIGATTAFALDQDVSVAATMGGIAVENNWSKTMLAFMAANIGLTAHQAYTAYEEDGIEGAVTQVAVGGVVGYVGGSLINVGAKTASKFIPWSQIRAAWGQIVSQNPALARSLGHAYQTLSQAVARGEVILDRAAERTIGRLLSRFGTNARHTPIPKELSLTTERIYHPSYLDKQAKGLLAEVKGQTTLERARYTILPSKLPGNRGIDTVAVKFTETGAVDHILVVESKYSASGYAKLPKRLAKVGKNDEKIVLQQMDDTWIKIQVDLMKKSINPEIKVVGLFLEKNKHLIHRVTNTTNATQVNRWNTIELPTTKIFKR